MKRVQRRHWRRIVAMGTDRKAAGTVLVSSVASTEQLRRAPEVFNPVQLAVVFWVVEDGMARTMDEFSKPFFLLREVWL